MVVRIISFVLALLVTVGVLTYVAGEMTEVAILRTYDKGGAPHDTKLWVVDYNGTSWVRVGKPRRLWYRRLLRRPSVELRRGPHTYSVTAHAHTDLETRQALDQRFREKYGLVDWWYGVLIRRGAVPIQLEPRDSAREPLTTKGQALPSSGGAHAQ
jgi:Uncharacterized protein conserved in bacteria (DUF2255)